MMTLAVVVCPVVGCLLIGFGANLVLDWHHERWTVARRRAAVNALSDMDARTVDTTAIGLDRVTADRVSGGWLPLEENA